MRIGARRMNDKDRPMPPLIAFAGALVALAVVRWAHRTALRVNRELEEARLARMAETAVEPAGIPTLRRDANAGAYRPGGPSSSGRMPGRPAVIPSSLARSVPRA